MTTISKNILQTARELVDTCQLIIDAAIEHASVITENGRLIDDYQIHTERLAYLTTQVRAAHELTSYAERLDVNGQTDELQREYAYIYSAEVANTLRSQIDAAWGDFGLNADHKLMLDAPELINAMREGLNESRIREVGKANIEAYGVNTCEIEDETATLIRDMTREFAKNEVAPLAQNIHRENLLVPDSLIDSFSEQGFWGSSIPAEYGGTGMGDLPMIIMTEELSAASLASAAVSYRHLPLPTICSV